MNEDITRIDLGENTEDHHSRTPVQRNSYMPLDPLAGSGIHCHSSFCVTIWLGFCNIDMIYCCRKSECELQNIWRGTFTLLSRAIHQCFSTSKKKHLDCDISNLYTTIIFWVKDISATNKSAVLHTSKRLNGHSSNGGVVTVNNCQYFCCRLVNVTGTLW